MLPLDAIARALVRALALDDTDRAALAPSDPAGVWLSSDQPVARLGLRLDAGPPPYGWARGLDAVVVHRPWGLWPARWPTAVGVVAVHGALDAWLWTTAHPALARALGVVPEDAPLLRDGRRVGVVGPAPADVLRRLRATTGRPEAIVGDARRPAERVAVAGAMTDALVRDAAARGATHYITGQVRAPGRAAAEATGIVVVATGQASAEAWALGALAAAARLMGVAVVPRFERSSARRA